MVNQQTKDEIEKHGQQKYVKASSLPRTQSEMLIFLPSVLIITGTSSENMQEKHTMIYVLIIFCIKSTCLDIYIYARAKKTTLMINVYFLFDFDSTVSTVPCAFI